MFSREGCTNVTLYVLFDGEDVGSPDIQPNRTRLVIPLEEIYGQPLPDIKIPDNLPGNEENPVQPDQGTAPATPAPAVTPAPGSVPAPWQQTVPGGNQDKETGKGTDADTGKDEDQDTETETGKEKETGGGNEKEGEPQNGEGKKDDHADASSMPETEPEKKPGSLRYLWWIPIIAAGAGTIWFIVFRRRSDEEEEG